MSQYIKNIHIHICYNIYIHIYTIYIYIYHDIYIVENIEKTFENSGRRELFSCSSLHLRSISSCFVSAAVALFSLVNAFCLIESSSALILPNVLFHFT